MNKFIICLDGVHGVGKTTLCDTFRASGYKVFSGDAIIFKHLKKSQTHRQISWISEYFTELKRALKKNGKKNKPLIVDRSPFAGALYSSANLIVPTLEIVKTIIEENDLKLFNVLMYRESACVKQQILKRAVHSSENDVKARQDLNEFDESYFDTIYHRFYREYNNIFDCTIEDASMQSVIDQFNVQSHCVFEYAMPAKEELDFVFVQTKFIK